MEKETQQREGHTSTRSLPHRRVTSKSDTSPGKKQPPDQEEIERFLRMVDLFKPRIISTILVVIGLYDYFHNSDVPRFLILMGAAAGYIPLHQAIDLLLGRSMPTRLSPPSEEQEARGQPGETAAEDRDELT